MTERVLITGAAGNVGRLMRPRLTKEGRILRLLDVAPLTAQNDAEEVVQASVADLDAVLEACEGVDAIIHMGGHSTEKPWADILDVNINGTYNIFEAARRKGVPRVIFASSNHAVGYQPRTAGIAPDYLFPAPDTYYGVSKVAGEGLGALYHHRYGLDVICVRIGSCFEQLTSTRMLSTWLSPDDAGRLFEACLTTPKPGYRVVWGISNNTRRWFSLDEARALGYSPHDDAEVYAEELIAKYGEPDLTQPEHRLLGGSFAGRELDADNL